jgi:hypothetical protein
MNLFDKIFMAIYLGIGIPSVMIISVMPVYLIKKYKTINALFAFWEYSTKNELRILITGYAGFFLCVTLIILYEITDLLG